jgi:hypothetical protein
MGLGVLTDERTQHRYQTCRDESCERFACRIWREGVREGYQRGAAGGDAQAHTEGYAAGAASCGDG